MTIQIFKGVQNQELVLKADYDKLAAECAALIDCAKNMALALDQDSEEAYPFWQNEVDTIESGNTAVFIAELKAQGVELLAEDLATPNPELADGTNKINKAVAWYCRQFAANLRAGVK